jgi:hypothetical protein
MNRIEKFLQDEINHTTRAITRLTDSLNESAGSEISQEGEHERLRNEQEKLTFLQEVVSTDNPILMSGMIFAAQEEAQKDHALDEYREAGNHVHSAQWWHSLENREYLTYLSSKVTELTLHK